MRRIATQLPDPLTACDHRASPRHPLPNLFLLGPQISTLEAAILRSFVIGAGQVRHADVQERAGWPGRYSPFFIAQAGCAVDNLTGFMVRVD